jgi:hypothetical protein
MKHVVQIIMTHVLNGKHRKCEQQQKIRELQQELEASNAYLKDLTKNWQACKQNMVS